jgi:FixJ family two-component response regulator
VKSAAGSFTRRAAWHDHINAVTLRADVDEPSATVFIVDDDADVRTGLLRLFRSANRNAKAFASAREFLDDPPGDGIGCILLDVSMPGMSGPELHRVLAGRGLSYPVIYLTGNSTVTIGVNAMKNGAVDFLEKPVDDEILLGAIEQAIARHRDAQAQLSRSQEIRRRLDALSARELEVMRHVIQGRLNKQIAFDLGIALKTVKVHRGRAMAKMQVRSVAELVRLCEADDIASLLAAGDGRR